MWAPACDDLAGKVNPAFTRPSLRRHDPLLDSRPRRATDNGHPRDRTSFHGGISNANDTPARSPARRHCAPGPRRRGPRPGPGRLHREHRHQPLLQGVQEGRPLLRLQQRRRGRGASSSRARPASASRGSASARTARPSSPTTRRRWSCSSSSTACREKVDRPKPPTLNIVWRDGKTRMTIGSNFYLEMSNRVQVRYTHEFPDDADQARRHRERGRQQGQLPHPPRQAEVRGLVLQALAASTRSRRTGRASRARTSPTTSRTRTSTGT